MHEFRVTKYNPQFRTPRGTYSRSEWTSRSDIGRVYEGVELTLAEYQRVEDAYLGAAAAFLSEAQVAQVTVCGLELALIDYPPVAEGEQLTIEQLREALRGVLREEFWCRFEADNAFVHVGYDYRRAAALPQGPSCC
ncbi:hypothetical protein [Anatilimnocola floriformis]|uniref:hypothetical protein n=1 Tax=Anatilimnocola floriformis TaxID=2948575 RepID=UPI0020C5768F|nr:hypothetical protein [Anatilimnocola floriformis]